ncbi:MAG TPA: RNA 2',3'-cyclic phosphodiesterase, partial [Longimicrobiales bacterium]|nr:RNA 2',3'-cyclic phosphodiesterase [Longimicrobiales bacterium]
MRLFVAINLPAAERRRIHRAAGALRDHGLPIRWVEPDNFHVTLKFLGQIRREAVGEVEQAVAKAARGNAPFEATIGGFGAFPTIRRPRVLWMGVEA